jgi:AbrB family looped-hinge helix DNA binding protein
MLVTVSPKGQITIPQVLRERHGIFPRMKLDISATPDGKLVLMPVDGLSKAARAIALLEQLPTGGLSTDNTMAITRYDPPLSG